MKLNFQQIPIKPPPPLKPPQKPNTNKQTHQATTQPFPSLIIFM